jgi:thiol-disulfide isomerase/thioredoxin/YHS domain-containing protein
MPVRCFVSKLSFTALVGVAGLFTFTQDALADRARKAQVWQTDFEKAQKEARRLARPMLVHFYADWCGPCKKMEADVLSSPDLARQLTDRFIAVKINADKNLALVEKYEVHSLPADVFLEPTGRVISRSEGYHSKGDYLSRVAKIDARWSQTRKQQIASSPNAGDSAGADGPQLGGPSLGRAPAGPPASDAPQPSTPGSASQAAPPSSVEPAEASNSNSKADEEFIGLDGYSPVTLGRDRKWVKGNPAHTAEFKGIKYWMVNAEEVTAFNTYAERYAPRLLGCDPVILWKSDRALPGNTQFGAYYAGELYLFVSAESRAEFKLRPDRYVRARHVLRPEQIERSGTRRAAAEPDTVAR